MGKSRAVAFWAKAATPSKSSPVRGQVVLGEDGGLHLGATQLGHQRGQVAAGALGEGHEGGATLEGVRRGEPDQQALALGRHLRHDHRTVGPSGQAGVEHLAVEAGVGGDLGQHRRDRETELEREPAHPVELLEHLLRVLAGGALGGELEHAGPGLGHGRGDRPELVGVGVGTRDVVAVGGLVAERAGGGEAERTELDGLAHERRHLFDLVPGGVDVADGPVAHHPHPQGAVGDLGADVHRPRRVSSTSR